MKRTLLLLVWLLTVPAAMAEKHRTPRHQAITLRKPELYALGTDSLVFRSGLDLPGRVVKSRTTYEIVYLVTYPGFPEAGHEIKLHIEGNRATRYQERQLRRSGEKKPPANNWNIARPKRNDTLPVVYTVHFPRQEELQAGELTIEVLPFYRPKPRREPIPLRAFECRIRIQPGPPSSSSPEAMRHEVAPMALERMDK